ncbi:phage tail protein [Aquabacterium sp.]|uniref:phage tail protein n=1 Tax=Aquabacterium sp. TaxID=1872578 RepID=UPI002619AF97|nr:phage tail protein [Aquabacterium sp.]MDD2978261.1 phage tail protein [Aquabacterium sp.]
MMMAFGDFVFSLNTIAYQELQRQTDWRHPSSSRVGARPARQFVGPGDDSITMTGRVVPEFGDRWHLDNLRAMADTGNAWVLVDGSGRVYGQFVIEILSENGSLFQKDGTPLQIDFSIKLTRVDDNLTDTLGTTGATR